jgi:hypothetical protein
LWERKAGPIFKCNIRAYMFSKNVTWDSAPQGIQDGPKKRTTEFIVSRLATEARCLY